MCLVSQRADNCMHHISVEGNKDSLDKYHRLCGYLNNVNNSNSILLCVVIHAKLATSLNVYI